MIANADTDNAPGGAGIEIVANNMPAYDDAEAEEGLQDVNVTERPAFNFDDEDAAEDEDHQAQGRGLFNKRNTILCLTATCVMLASGFISAATVRTNDKNNNVVSKNNNVISCFDCPEDPSAPSVHPTPTPSWSPSASPTARPSVHPTVSPSMHPTSTPSVHPTARPSVHPTVSPSWSPSASPTARPSVHPTATPPVHPTTTPSVHPTSTPSMHPTATPSAPNAKASKLPKAKSEKKQLQVQEMKSGGAPSFYSFSPLTLVGVCGSFAAITFLFVDLI